MSTLLGDLRVLKINAKLGKDIAWSFCYGQPLKAPESQHVGIRISIYKAVAELPFEACL